MHTKMQPEVVITGKPTNFGDGDEMQMPCFLRITGKKDYIGILENKLIKYTSVYYSKERKIKNMYKIYLSFQ